KRKVEAVKGVNMRVDAGEIFGFLGPNGAGKTTTLRMLATLLTPDGGSASVVGFDLRRSPGKVRERIGYVSQSGGAERPVTARENLVLQAQFYGMSRSAAKTRAAEMLRALDLESYGDRKVSTYSGGQRRRLDIALGMVHRPTLLFLDEPTTGLDPQSRAHMWDEVRRVREEGTTIFITTHYLDEADALCDRLAIMDGGLLVAEGTPTELKRQIAGDAITVGLRGEVVSQGERLLREQPYVRELSATEPDAPGAEGIIRLYVDHGEQALPQVLRTLDGAGVTATSISLARPSLDDVFLRQTGRSLRDGK
ncbi:MAG TPA: ATP-binding cassette domain-containing protein, partial [Ktedonobacterales bacterium]